MLADVQELVGDLVRDDASRISPDQRDRAIGLAVVQYSKDRPRRAVEDIAGDGGRRLALPAGAIRAEAVEYPVTDGTPVFLATTAWGHYNAPNGPQLVFTRTIPAGAPLRLHLLRPHALTDAEDTIPLTDREALASYAAAVLFDQIAATTSGDGNPTIPADAVNHASKPESFAKRAERLRQRYYDLLGIDVKRTQPASAMAVQPLAASDGGHRLTHYRRRWR